MNLKNIPFYSKGMATLIYSVALLTASGISTYAYFNITEQPDAKQQAQNQQLSNNGASANTSIPDVAPAIVQYVEEQLRIKFLAGAWRYGGIDHQNGLVQAYIQIPDELDLDPSYQAQYIKRSVCPAPHDQMWSKLSPKQLKIHLYTNEKSHSVSTICG